MMDFIADDIGLVNSSDVVTYITKNESGSQISQPELFSTDREKMSEQSESDLELGIYSDENDLLTLKCNRSTDSVQEGNKEKKFTSSKIQDTSQVQSVLARKVKNKAFSNGDVFSGLVDIITGVPLRGKLSYAKSGDIYDGPFLQGIRHGDGAVLTKGDGTKFLGSFKNDQPSEGTLITSEFTYNGHLLVLPKVEQNKEVGNNPYIFHGTDATLMQKNGHVYEGDFSHGRYHGVGQERAPTGLIYRGQYRAGKWHGNGELTFEKRSQETNRKTSSNPVQHTATAEKQNGEVCNTDRNRKKYLKFNPNAFRYTYTGTWEHGEREGRGFEKIIFAIPSDQASEHRRKNQFTSSNIEERTATFSGEFHKDQRYGCGELTLPDGTVLVGNWKCGRPVTMARGEVDDFSEKRVKNELAGSSKLSRRASWTNLVSASGNCKSHKKRSRPSWTIEFNNGNFYKGECALMSGSVDGVKISVDRNDRDPMRSHLHINTSMVLCIIPHGHGTMTYSSKKSTSCDVYIGNFRLGKRHGYGRIAYHKTNEEYDGTWIDDIPGEVGGQQLHVHKPQFDHSVNDEDKDDLPLLSSSCVNSSPNVPQVSENSEASENLEIYRKINIIPSRYKKKEDEEQGEEEEEEARQLEQAVEVLINCGSSASSSSSTTPKRSSFHSSTSTIKKNFTPSLKINKNIKNVEKLGNNIQEQDMYKQSRQKNRRGDNTPSTTTLSNQGDDDDGSITIATELNAMSLHKLSNHVKEKEIMESEESL